MNETEVRHAALISEVLAGVGRFRRQVRRSAGAMFPGRDLGESQTEFLRLVGRRPGLSVSAAAAELGLAANTASTLVTRLAAAGLLTKDPDPADRRVGRLTLAPESQELSDATRRRRHSILSTAVKSLTDLERQNLFDGMAVLTKLTDQLSKEEEGHDCTSNRMPRSHTEVR